MRSDQRPELLPKHAFPLLLWPLWFRILTVGTHFPTSLESNGLQCIESPLPSVVPIAKRVWIICVRDWEVEQRGVAWHAKSLAEPATTVAGTVDFSNIELTLRLVDFVEFVPNRLQSLAVATPWGEEFNEPR